MNLFFDCDINCVIYFKKKKRKIMQLKWSYLMTKFIAYLYDEYGDEWIYFEAFFDDTGNPYGKIHNTSETLDLKNKELKKTDFDSIVVDNFKITCELFLKSTPDCPQYFTITKEHLLNNFIREISNLYGTDWKYFNTFFEDSGEVAYGAIENTYYLRKKNKLTASSLKDRRFNINRKKWEEELSQKPEIFYVLKFTDSDFIKIGHTYREIEYRLYNYIFPNSSNEKKIYLNKNIDFEKSFIVNTNLTKEKIDDKLVQSLESTIKKEFKEYRFENEKYGKSSEILDNECLPKIIEFLKSKKQKLKYLDDYSGFKNGNEMKEYNLKEGIKNNVLSFYTKKNKPIVYLKNND